MKKLTLLLAMIFCTILEPVLSQVYQDSAFNALIRKYNGGWIAGDATFSIALPDGRTMWLFGDSFIGTANPDSSIAPGSHFIRNCAMIQDGDSMRALYSGTFNNPDALVSSPKPDSLWYWPEHGIVENDTLKIFYSEFIITTGVPGFNFKYTGAYLVFFTYPGIEYINKQHLPYYDQNGVCYGNSIMVENGYTYVYGRNETSATLSYSYPHVARVPVGNLLAPWQFFNGTSWTADPSASYKIGNVAVSQQYGFFKQDGKYVLLSQEIWLSSRIYSYTTSKPYGPLTNKVLLYQTPVLYSGSFTYNAFPHVQFTQNSELLVSYNTNGDFWSIFGNVEIYRPLFIRVPLNLIDPTFTGTPSHENRGFINTPLRLHQNIPNPAYHTTEVTLEIDSKQYVSLELKDMRGRKLQSHINRELLPGTYTVTMDLKSLSGGVYCYGIGEQQMKLIKY